jgi:hypothetical protein
MLRDAAASIALFARLRPDAVLEKATLKGSQFWSIVGDEVDTVIRGQIIGHASTSILSTYARGSMDTEKRNPQMELLRNDHALREANSQRPTSSSVQ